METEDELLKQYIGMIQGNKVKTKKIFAFGLIGLPGVGKSFVAQKLSEKFGLYVASNDEIRRFLNKKGLEGESPNQELVQRIADARTEFLYKNKISHIIDADLIAFQELAKNIAITHDAVVLFLHVVVPRKVALKRIKQRLLDVSNDCGTNFSLADVDKYNTREKVHAEISIKNIFMQIDNSIDLEPQLNLLGEKLVVEGYLYDF